MDRRGRCPTSKTNDLRAATAAVPEGETAVLLEGALAGNNFNDKVYPG
jgi:hypothetical protein